MADDPVMASNLTNQSMASSCHSVKLTSQSAVGLGHMTKTLLKTRKKENKLVSFWILTSCRPHRATSGQSNSASSKLHVSNLFCSVGSSSSNWILMSCQPHRVTSGQSTQVISKYTFLNSSHIHINPLSSQSTKPITSQT